MMPRHTFSPFHQHTCVFTHRISNNLSRDLPRSVSVSAVEIREKRVNVSWAHLEIMNIFAYDIQISRDHLEESKSSCIS